MKTKLSKHSYCTIKPSVPVRYESRPSDFGRRASTPTGPQPMTLTLFCTVLYSIMPGKWRSRTF